MLKMLKKKIKYLRTALKLLNFAYYRGGGRYEG